MFVSTFERSRRRSEAWFGLVKQLAVLGSACCARAKGV